MVSFQNKNRVAMSEKLHGTMVLIAHNLEDSNTIVSSKGMLKQGLSLEESDENTYWVAAKNDDVVGRIQRNFTEGVIQVFGEVIPVQGGYNYGQTKPTVRVFDVRVNNVFLMTKFLRSLKKFGYQSFLMDLLNLMKLK